MAGFDRGIIVKAVAEKEGLKSIGHQREQSFVQPDIVRQRNDAVISKTEIRVHNIVGYWFDILPRDYLLFSCLLLESICRIDDTDLPGWTHACQIWEIIIFQGTGNHIDEYIFRGSGLHGIMPGNQAVV